MSDSNKIFVPEPIRITILDRANKLEEVFLIQEFVLEDRIKFVRILADVMQDFFKSYPDVLREKDNYSVAISLIKVAGEKMAEIYALVLNRPVEWCRANITIKNEVEIVKAVLEINEFDFLVNAAREMYQKFRITK